jgi:hypothetical protein
MNGEMIESYLFPEQSIYEVRFIIDGDTINTIRSDYMPASEMRDAMERFVLNAHGNYVVAILYNRTENREVERLWRRQETLNAMG